MHSKLEYGFRTKNKLGKLIEIFFCNISNDSRRPEASGASDIPQRSRTLRVHVLNPSYTTIIATLRQKV